MYPGKVNTMAVAAAAISLCAGAGDEKGSMPEALRTLHVDHGDIVSVERCETGVFTDAARRTHSNLPPRVMVKARLSPAAGSNINVEAWLPAPGRWNGRFVGLGNGGPAGHIDPLVLVGPLGGGSAVATTDMGTAPDPSSGVGNREVWKDFGFRATHLMTVLAKQLIHAYYGKGPDRSYFFGGSTGGQQALQEAQRYPEDYDGIVAGVPGHCRTPLHAYFLWNAQILHGCPFSASQQQCVIAAANAYMASREVPQTAGKLISDPRCSQADIEAVIALARQQDPTLTDAQAEALQKLFDGPRHATTGERIFCGIPLGSSFDIAQGHLYVFKWVFGADRDPMDLDFGKDIDTYTAALGPYLNAENPDLSRFAERGGKLIMYSGSADSCVPYHATLDYYERVIEHFGSLERVSRFFKFYMIPGMSHGPGPGINSLPNLAASVIDWREKGIEPGMISGKRVIDGKKEMELPLYPYPTKTGWDAETGFRPVDGPRLGVARVAERFRPAAAE